MRWMRVLPGIGLSGWLLASAAAAQMRVACVGDSITEGYGLATPATDAYPAQLQASLGTAYDVRNFGVSGTTARKQGDKPYWNEAAYTQSTTFAPNVVLIMLGTNDAKPQNWDATAFRTDYTALVQHYHELGARVLIATPPKVFGAGAFDISPSTVADTLVPLVRELAPQVDAELVDIFVVTQDHSDWFPDTVHPSRDGAAALAGAFAAAVQAAPETEATTAPSGSSATPSTPGANGSESDSMSETMPGEATHSESQPDVIPSGTSSPVSSNSDALPSPVPPPPAPATNPVTSSPPQPTATATPPAATPGAPSGATPNTATPSATTSGPTANPAASRADSGCSIAGNTSREPVTGATVLGLAMAAWGARRKWRKPVASTSQP